MTRLALPWSDPVGSAPSPLHGPHRQWSETNCYMDLWIEVLHAMGADPRPSLSCAFAASFDDPQWTFLKPDEEDLRQLHGVRVEEMYVWRPVADHIAEQLERGRLLTVEVDAWWLPDTAGVSYRCAHSKTSIVVGALDVEHGRLGYFHGAGYHELGGEDFAGLVAPAPLPPYVELVRFGPRPVGAELDGRAVAAARRHLARRGEPHAVGRMAAGLAAAVERLGDGPEQFHLWAFGTWRQCGATAELAGDWCRWAGAARAGDAGVLARAAASFDAAAAGAKAAQFAAARAARGRPAGLAGAATSIDEAWEQGLDLVADALSSGRSA